MAVPLACTVRGCELPLERRERAWVCAQGHSYDTARSGYINLLQPQDRRSLTAGDSALAIQARADLLATGVGSSVLDALTRHAGRLDLRSNDTVVDLGAGSGDALAALHRMRAVAGIGIDISKAAAERAARLYPGLTWLVANADRRLPLRDRSVALVISLFGRRNPAECVRILAAGGHLLVAVPGHDDLIELRTQVQGEPRARDRAALVIDVHAPLFSLLARETLREQHTLTSDALSNLWQGTYRIGRRGQAERVAALGPLTVTLSSELLVFAPR